MTAFSPVVFFASGMGLGAYAFLMGCLHAMHEHESGNDATGDDASGRQPLPCRNDDVSIGDVTFRHIPNDI